MDFNKDYKRHSSSFRECRTTYHKGNKDGDDLLGKNCSKIEHATTKFVTWFIHKV